MSSAPLKYNDDYVGQPMIAAEIAATTKDPAKLQKELQKWEDHKTTGEKFLGYGATLLRGSEFAAGLIPGPGWVGAAVLHVAASAVGADIEGKVKNRIHAENGSVNTETKGKLFKKHVTLGLLN